MYSSSRRSIYFCPSQDCTSKNSSSKELRLLFEQRLTFGGLTLKEKGLVSSFKPHFLGCCSLEVVPPLQQPSIRLTPTAVKALLVIHSTIYSVQQHSMIDSPLELDSPRPLRNRSGYPRTPALMPTKIIQCFTPKRPLSSKPTLHWICKGHITQTKEHCKPAELLPVFNGLT